MKVINDFFKDLAIKIGLPEFFRANTLIFNNLLLALVAALCLIALILVIVLVPWKGMKKPEPSEKWAKEDASEDYSKVLTEETPEDAVTEEDVSDEQVSQERVEQDPAQQAQEPSEQETDDQSAQALAEKPAAQVADEDQAAQAVASDTAESENKKNGGKYEIVKRNGAFYFLLKANNGQLLLESSAYTTLAGAKKAIDTFKNAVEVGEFSIDEDKNGNFKFILRASARSQMLYHGETYATRQRAESAIGSVKNFAFTDVVKRMEEDDEDDSAATPVETLPLADEDHKEGGKYEIEERSGSFYFLLKANNGQLLLESPAFTTEQGAKAGIETFKKAADTGFFVVDVDKKGKFRFILRANARAQMRYYGESYSTRQSAESSVHSVRSFAQKAVLK